jgi:hypothetical protein
MQWRENGRQCGLPKARGCLTNTQHYTTTPNGVGDVRNHARFGMFTAEDFEAVSRTAMACNVTVYTA